MNADEPMVLGMNPLRRDRGVAVMWSVIVVLVLSGLMFITMRKPGEVLPPPVKTALPVTTYTVVAVDVPEVVTFAGRVEAVEDVLLSADFSGAVVWLGADKGDSVTNGQPLLQVDNRTLSAGAERATASLKQADDDLRRFEELHKIGAISDSEYDGVRTRRDVSAASRAEAGAYLSKGEVSSPIQGVIDDRMIDVGEFAAPGMPVFRVMDISRVKVHLNLPERDVFAIRKDQEMTFTVDVLPGTVFTGKVSFVATAADAKSNTFRVEVLADNPQGVLKAGVIAKVAVQREQLKGVLTVPLKALIPGKGEHVAYVVVDGHAQRRIVKLISLLGDQGVVAEGLVAGERIIVEGSRLLQDGVAVEEKALAVNEAVLPEKGL